MSACNHQFEVGSPIDTVETCVRCGATEACEPIINSVSHASRAIPGIPDEIADLARAAYWIDCLSIRVEADMTPDDTWFRATTGGGAAGGVTGKWRFGSIVEAVESAVINSNRRWTEYDASLFGQDRAPCSGFSHHLF